MHYFKPYLLRKTAFDIPTPGDFIRQIRDGLNPDEVRRRDLQQQHQQQRLNLLRNDYESGNRRNTRIPANPQFKKPDTQTRLNNNHRGDFNPYIAKGSLDRDNDVFQVAYPGNKNVSPGWHKLTNATVPFYSNARHIWDVMRQGNMTNKQFINAQAGDDNYFDRYMQHLNNATDDELKQAGIYLAPEARRRQYGDTKAIQPNFANADSPNAYYDPEVPGGGITFEQSTPGLGRAFNQVFRNDNTDAGFMTQPVSFGGNKMRGTIYGHEFTHRSSIPTIKGGAQLDPASGESLKDTFSNLNGHVNPYRMSITDEPALFSPMYTGYYDSNDPHARYSMGEGMPYEPMVTMPAEAMNDDGTINTELLKQYRGFDPSVIYDPNMSSVQIGQLSNNFEDASGKGLNEHSYAFDADEARQGLQSLNRGQSLLQQAIRRNPQAFIDAGASQEQINAFLSLPEFPDSVQDFDQRMEFYANNPLFMQFLGQEPARAIERYFWLERERRNGDQSEQYQKSMQDRFDFYRANGRLMGNNLSPRYLNTGMGRYMTNTMGSSPVVQS